MTMTMTMTASMSPAAAAASTTARVREKMNQLSYTLFGPTTSHLQYEFYLLLSLILLTISSLQGLYKDSFGTPGDVCYLLLTATWLSRHLAIRWLCMWDSSTSTRPTIRGFFSHFLTTHVTGGQTFDRPPSYRPWLVKQVGCGPSGPKGGGGGGGDDLSMVHLRNLIPSSLLYLVQIPWMWICLPLLDILQARQAGKSSRHHPGSSSNYAYSTGRYRSSSSSNNNNNSNNNNQNNRREIGSVQRFFQTSIQYFNAVWTSYGPTLQFLLPVGTLGYYLWFVCHMLYYGRHASLMNGPTEVAMSAQPTHSQKYVSEPNAVTVPPYGAYRRMEQPSLAQVWFYLAMLGTVMSLILFRRLTLPLPDQVAGSNAMKDMRNEARNKSTHQSSGGGGGGGGGGSKSSSSNSNNTRGGGGGGGGGGGNNSNNSSSSGGSSRDMQDAVWTEQNQSIQTEHRITLTFHVTIIRWLDNLLVCGILPRTSYACRATGHCPAHKQIWQLSKVLYPAGITSPLRKDGAYGTAFALLAPDPWSALWTVLGVTMVTGVLLLAQAISLNKAYLAIMGYLCAGEWTLVETPAKGVGTGLTPSSSSSSSTPTPAAWDPRRKYKKGDLILYPPNSRRPSVYRATFHSPEGRPYHRHLHAAHELLRNELGHLSTSELLLKAALVQLVYVALNGALWMGYQLMGYPAYGLLTALAANLLAAHAVLDVGTSNANELRQLHAEIAPPKSIVPPSQ